MAALVDTPLVCPVLIGRGRHRDALAQAVEAAAGGAGRTVLLAGEAGIGKSRLVGEVRALAVQRRSLVLEGRTFETDRTLPYAPLLDLLRGCVAALPPQALAHAAGADAPELARLLPELAVRLPGVTPAPAQDPEADKRRLFQALAGFLLRLAPARPGPLLLVVEDVHWADDSSLEFLAVLARRIARQPVLLLITYRSDEVHPALRHFLTVLDRERLAADLTLPPLTASEVEAMVQAILGRGGSVSTTSLQALFELTEGNPFFIEEVLRTLVRHGEEDADLLDRLTAGGLPVPRTVDDAVQRRLAGLSEAAREVLVLAAVAGRRWDFALLQELTGREEAELLDLVKEGIGAQLVVEESADRFAFRHALTRQAIYTGLLARERRALHGRIAATIERQAGIGIGARLPELAYHCSEAGLWRQALASARRAGEQAQAMDAPRAAVEQFSRALAAARALDMPPLIELHRARGKAYETIGEFEPARADYEAAHDAARDVGNLKEEWRGLLDLGFLWASRDYARAGTYYDRALAVARTIDDPSLVAHSLNRMGNWHFNANHPLKAQRYHEEALAAFEAVDDRRGIAETADLLGLVTSQIGPARRAKAYFQRALVLFRELGDRRGTASSLGMMAELGLADDSDAPASLNPSIRTGIQQGAFAARTAREIGWRAGEAYALEAMTLFLYLLGEYDQALKAARGGLDIAETIEHRQWTVLGHLVLGAVHLDLLALPVAHQHIEQAVALAREISSPYWLHTSIGFLALTRLAQGEPGQAEKLLDTVMDPDAPAWNWPQRICWAARAELALAQGDPARALAVAEHVGTQGENLLDLGPVHTLSRVRGEALIALGRLGEAETVLQAALEAADTQRMRPLSWRYHAALARLYRAWGRPGDAARALTTARAIVEELAACVPDELVPELGRSLREHFRSAATHGFPPSRPPTPLKAAKQAYGGLTTREREVAALIAQGKSNPEIAVALVIGKRTVQTHISSIFAKLGCTSRAQVAAWAVAHRLVGEDG